MNLFDIAKEFVVRGEVISISPFGSGHINDTFCVETSASKYVLQRMNHHIFREPYWVQENISNCLESIKKGSQQFGFEILELIAHRNNEVLHKDELGNYWRMYTFVENSISYDLVNHETIAFEGARAFGFFQKEMALLSPEKMHVVIPDFHRLDKRLCQFYDALESAEKQRIEMAAPEIAMVYKYSDISEKLALLLEEQRIPIRITHNDTKINNVLFDRDTLKAKCVVDLDTVMPGTVLFDFGDMMRTFLSCSEEDERDLSMVYLRKEIFLAMAKGYFSEMHSIIIEEEKEHLVFGGKVMTFMIGIRFLTDFLQGDIYYKTSCENHNLYRARTQFKLLNDIIMHEKELYEIIQQLDNDNL